MSLSRSTSDKMRGYSVKVMTPLWETFLSLKHSLLNPSEPSPFVHFSLEEENQRLQLENQLFENEIFHLQQLLKEQQSISLQMTQIIGMDRKETQTGAENYQSLQSTLQTLKKRTQAVPARVIFRSFDSWNSFLWINIGNADNQNYPAPMIMRNSPVIIGKAIVGVIDYVGEHQSRVRLISDSQLTPSVRAARGSEQDFMVCSQIENLLEQINKNQLPLSLEKKDLLAQLLMQLKQNLMPLKKTWYLAKGTLMGSVFSTRLGHAVTLKGTGFNYDFADEEGESRDLRNGRMSNSSQKQEVPIIKVNDLLMTTGMDGIFPPGFQAGIVSKVGLLKEGDYFYDLEAQPIVGSLNELALVFVLPPTSKESIDLKL